MPDLSNAGSGSRNTRSGRNNSQINTRVGPTQKVQLVGRELPLENSQAIMSGGLAKANAVGQLGQALGGFFGTIEQAQSDLQQVERAEQLRVAEENKKERDKLKLATENNLVQSTTSKLYNNWLAKVGMQHNEFDADSLADKSEEYFTINFGEGTGDPFLDQRIKGSFDSAVMPHLSQAAEDRVNAIRQLQFDELLQNMSARPGATFNTPWFLSDFSSMQAIRPDMQVSEVSALVMGAYADIATQKGQWPEFSTFIYGNEIIDTNQGRQTFASRFPNQTFELATKGWAKYQSQQTFQSSQTANGITSQINNITFEDGYETKLAEVAKVIMDFSDSYGDASNTSSLNKTFSQKAEALAKQQLEVNQWNALGMGVPSNITTESYNQKQLNKIIGDPSTNIFDPNLSDQDFAQVSSNAAQIVTNHTAGMGTVSKRLQNRVAGMVMSDNPVVAQRGFVFLQKLKTLDAEAVPRMLGKNPMAFTMYEQLEANVSDTSGSNDAFLVDENLREALTNDELVTISRQKFYDEYDVENDTALVQEIFEDGAIFDNDFKELISDFVDVDEDDLFIAPGQEFADILVKQMMSTSIQAGNNGESISLDDIIERSINKLAPNLHARDMGNGRYRIDLKDADNQPASIDYTSSLQGDGSLHNQAPDTTSMTNPYNPTETVNPRENMKKDVEAIKDTPMLDGLGDNVGYRVSDDASGAYVLTVKSELGVQQDIFLSAGDTYDVTPGFGFSRLGDIISDASENAQSKQTPSYLSGRMGVSAAPSQETDKPLDLDVMLELTGDITLDMEAMKAISDKLPESMHLVPVYPNGASPAEIKNGTVKAIGYNIRVFPNIRKEDIPEVWYDDKVIEDLSNGSSVDPNIAVPKVNNGYSSGRLGIPLSQSNSQSTTEIRNSVIDGVTGAMRKQRQIAPTVGLTSEVMVEDSSLLNDFGWLLQDLQKKVKGYMGTEADPTYKDRRFAMIGEREAWRAEAYWDGVKSANGGKGYRTVGYGFNMDSVGHKELFIETLKVDGEYFQSVYDGNVQITEAQGKKLFNAAVAEAESIIDNRLKDVDLNNQQRLALVSMAYNSPKLIGPNLIKALKSGDNESALKEILYKSNATRMLGLYNRRYEEALTFAGADRNSGVPSYLAYMADVLPDKYGPMLANKFGTSSKKA